MPVPSPDGVWFFDTGASSHMTGARDAFTSLDDTVHSSMHFGDGSLVTISGKGNVMFRCANGNQHVLANVYYIPKLRANIISLGQLDEKGCRSVIEDGHLCVYDQQRQLLVRVKRMANRLYVLRLDLAMPVCLVAKLDEPAWLWHARLELLHFQAVKAMSTKGMVRGMPQVDHVDEICDGCMLGKQHRLAFPRASPHRSERALDLVHTDLCGPIKPATAGGNQYFLLVVDDYSRYMWLELLKSKDEAHQKFQRVQVMAEAEGGANSRRFGQTEATSSTRWSSKSTVMNEALSTTQPHPTHLSKTEWWSAAT